MNELIAIFDGWEFIKGDPTIICGSCDLGKQPSMYCVCVNKVDRFVKDGYKRYHNELKYHEDWNRLHDAWDKMYAAYNTLPADKAQDFYRRYGSQIQYYMYLGSKSEAHRILYEAIQWYNNTLNKQQ